MYIVQLMTYKKDEMEKGKELFCMARNWLARNHCAHAFVSQQLHEQRVFLTAIDDVSGAHSLGQRSNAAVHLHGSALHNKADEMTNT